MKLVFLGTRGYIDARTERHGMHSATMVSYYGKEVMVDCGEDWLGRAAELGPQAIVLTHAHPDHAWGLKEGAPCPVYATPEAWESLRSYPIEQQRVIQHREPAEIAGIAFEAFPILHSTRAPAVGYRICAGAVTVFYVPDVAWIIDRHEALSGAKVYIGDGATIRRPMVRKPGGTIIGHVPIRAQLTWCRKEGVPRAISTHCGSQIVEGDERVLGAEIRQLAEERGVKAEVAYDSMVVVLR